MPDEWNCGGNAVEAAVAMQLGLGVPFLLAAVFLNRSMALMNRIKRHMGLIEKLMGGLLLLVGFMLVTGLFTSFSFWLLETFPALATLG